MKTLLEPFHCDGDGAVTVLVDSRVSYWNHLIALETVPVMLSHFGVPYRIVDRTGVPLSADLLAACAAIVIAQAGLCGELSTAECRAIVAAVRSGTGLVNLDGAIRDFPRPLVELFGFTGINPFPLYTKTLLISRDDHAITAMQKRGELHTFSRPVTGSIVTGWDSATVPLAEAFLDKESLVAIRHLSPGAAYVPGNYPVLFARSTGSERAVQFALDPRMWREGFLGPVGGADDLLFRSILFAARKPFFCFPIPPYILLSIDDAEGSHDFGYARTAAELGLHPLSSLFLDRVPSTRHRIIRELHRNGSVHFNTHAFDYYDLLTFRFGIGEFGDLEISERFRREAAWWKQLGVPQAKTVRMHWGEYGRRGLTHLKETGRTYFDPALQPGMLKADMDLRDGYLPYGLQSCYYDRMREDLDFLCFAAMAERGAEDFLTGSTTFLGENRYNDPTKGASRGATLLTRAFRAGFFGELVTHEQKIAVLSPDEWKRTLAETLQAVCGFNPVPISHDELGDYLCAREKLRPLLVSHTDDGLEVTISGPTTKPVPALLIGKDDDGFRSESIAVASGRRRLQACR